MAFHIEYQDIVEDGIFPTPIPNNIRRLEDEECGIDYYVQIHLLDSGERQAKIIQKSESIREERTA